MASSSRSTRAWPFVLNWLRHQTRPKKAAVLDFDEYISGLGMLQVNEERRQAGLMPLVYATILTGIHESFSDPLPHATLAAATREMKARNQHIVVHSRVSQNVPGLGVFRGTEAFVDNIRHDDYQLQQSYTNPIPVRTSLKARDADSVPVGCTGNDHGITQWYVLNAEQEMVYLEDSMFYRVGEGARCQRISGVLEPGAR